jgi:REP element-mobilizing transposase RayT
MNRTPTKKMQQRRKQIRLKDYDYSSNGLYFVTISTLHRQPFLVKHSTIVESILKDIPNRFPGVHLDYYVLMKDHLHFILECQEVKVALGEIVRTFKALVTRNTNENHFWQRGFYEHIIRSEKALNRIREYIRNNPDEEKLKFDHFYR